jgi:chromatin remodeling complex protein RSC6
MDENEDKLSTKITEIINLVEHRSQETSLFYKEIKKSLKSLKKECKKVESSKQYKKKKTNRTPSGFAKPSDISNELRIFLGLPKGTKIARTEVTKKINIYIKERDLQNKDQKNVIVLDKELSKLLDVSDDEIITYFTLQKYLTAHFI